MARFSQRSLDTLKGIHPKLVKVLTEAIKTTPVDFTITNGVRTLQEQQTLYAKGRTTKGPKVTNADGIKNKSNHQIKSDGYGYAIDLYPFVNGAIDLNDKANNLKVIANHIITKAEQLGIKVEWGGNWKSIIDKPHFELKN